MLQPPATNIPDMNMNLAPTRGNWKMGSTLELGKYYELWVIDILTYNFAKDGRRHKHYKGVEAKN